MKSFVSIMKDFIKYFKSFKYLIYSDSYNLLGRWCHKGVPNCNDNVIQKKIDFALLDNNLCYKSKKETNDIKQYPDIKIYTSYNGLKKIRI